MCTVLLQLPSKDCSGLTFVSLMLQKYLSRLFKGAMVCGLFAAIFKGQSHNSPTLHRIYIIIIKVRFRSGQVRHIKAYLLYPCVHSLCTSLLSCEQNLHCAKKKMPAE